MGGCCSKNGDGTEGLARKLEEDNVEEEDDEERDDEDRLRFRYDFDDDQEDYRTHVGEGGARVRLKGSCGFASMYSQQGWKGANQDAMTIWEDFGGASDTVFCGVFDGHGPFGHRVACYARDKLPAKLSSGLDSLPRLQGECYGDESSDGDNDDDDVGGANSEEFSSWKEAFLKAFEELDKELRNHSVIDCICSGSTAVSIVRQKEHLIIANLGDSRAVLATRDNTNQLVPVQLTIDLKPNLPSEEERIKSCRGRVFALDEEPDIHRIWMPDEDCPGLAMARAFGDFCLKDFGLISTPQVFCRKLSEKDEFVVLATDGVWDVLTNKEVVKIVSSASKRSVAAKQVVERAVRAWRSKHPTSKVDDCAVVCLFLKEPTAALAAKPASFNAPRRHGARARDHSFSESFRTARSRGDASDVEEAAAKEEWTALEGLSRVNTLLRVPRIARALSWRRRSVKYLEEEVN